MYNILILGSGGREHALGWKLDKSPLTDKIYFGPGNAGTAEIGHNLDLSPLNFTEVHNAVREYKIDYILVGPEAPLVNGITDFFRDKEVKVIGPDKAAAQLEGSKSFANAFMEKYGIPTAASVDITKQNIEDGYDLIDRTQGPIVLKADGLAAGKGVLILEDKAEAKRQLKAMIINTKFGKASEKVVIEEFLDGIEFSVFVLTDGKGYQILPVAKDYKRIGEGDTGLNTGGMGAISPPPFVDDKLMKKVRKQIIEPTVKGITSEKFDYKGFIFFGLINVDGQPKVIEYNVRMGDPETEAVIPRVKSDLMDLFVKLHKGKIGKAELEVKKKTAATIMLVSQGYPEAYEKGKPITIDQSIEKSLIFHAGTKQKDYDTVTNGGRVIAVTSLGKDHHTALKKSLDNLSKIHFEGMHYRKDIGFDL